MATHQIPDDPFTQQLQRIRTQIAAGQLQQAAQALNLMQRQQPRDARVQLLGMRLAEQAGNLPGAAAAAQRALDLAPGWHVALIELAQIQARQGHHSQAMKNATQAVAQAPMDVEVLARAARIAGAALQYEQGATWLENVLTQQPGRVDIRAMLARFLLELDRAVESRAQYTRLLEDNPADDDALLGLVNCALALKEMDVARQHADALLARRPDSQSVQYVHALAHGRTPPHQPAGMVAEMFSGAAAEDFDVHLVKRLQYRAPQLAAQRLLQLHPDRKFNLLDLGCGTGLLGLYLGPLQGHIIGVDLSADMIARAAQHGLYSRFHQVNMLDALQATPASHYEAIACLDTLIYVGDLTAVIPNALRILKPGGHFIFTCEAAAEDEADLVLRPSGRYAHKASAVEHLCSQAGFEQVQIEQLPTLRMEGGQPLPGFMVTARKSLSA